MKALSLTVLFVPLALFASEPFCSEPAPMPEGWKVVPPPYRGNTIDVVVRNQAGAWTIVGLHDKSKPAAPLAAIDTRKRTLIKYQPRVDNLEDNEEVIAVDVENKAISTPAEPQPARIACTKSGRAMLGYNLCYSAFSSVDKGEAAKTSAATLFAGALTLGVAPLLTASTGTIPWHVHFDAQALATIAKESGTIEYARRLHEERRLAAYRQELGETQSMESLGAAVSKYSRLEFDPEGLLPTARSTLYGLQEKKKLEDYRLMFGSASTAAQVASFIAVYSAQQYDPEGLVERAKVSLSKLETQEAYNKKHNEYRTSFTSIASSSDAGQFIENWKTFDPDHLLPKAKSLKAELLSRERAEEAEQARIRKAELETERRRTRELQSFRKSLREGDSTNCGPVIEVKTSLIKIYFPVANYGNEHWVRRDEIYPSEYGCRFLNGRYAGPN